MIDTKEFDECFSKWIKDIAQITNNEIVAVDGKCLRGTKTGLTLVNAWACENQCVLAQEVVDSKSNEITAIPKILEKLDLSGAIVTMDAMGTQKKIAKQIIDQQADYVLSLKGNQSSLHQDAIRSHWSVENKLHWSLDVSFDEDRNTTRVGNSAENLSIVRHVALNLLKKDNSKICIKTKRMKAG